MKKNEKYKYILANSLKTLCFDKNIAYNSIEDVFKKTICKMSDSKYLYKNNIFITSDKNNEVEYFYYVYSYFSKYEDDLVELYDNKKLCMPYTYKSILIENTGYNYTQYYPAYLLIDIIKYIGKKLNIKYNVILSPLNKEKCIVYISNTKTDKILYVLRNKENTNEWDLYDYVNIALTIYEYFLNIFIKIK